MSEQKDSVPENNSEPNKTEVFDIPEWHKAILDERYEEYLKDPNRGISLKEFKKRLIRDGLI
ncbi:addiction module protein [uncultured Arcticibacterium sp.]|uniref:addiction module protein n=1 Tax=uncultured Arcticibacterium sp. TaxID=2173042 RepID=UPI0030FB8AEB